MLSAHLSKPPALMATASAFFLVEMPIPLAMKSPGSRTVRADLELRLLLALPDADRDVLALLLTGVLGNELVLPLMISVVPFGSRLNVVPETTMDWPGFNVVPGPSTYSVVPSRTVPEYVFPSIVRSGPGVMGPDRLIVDVTPLITTTEPEAVAGMEMVVPERTMTPPGVRVWPGPSKNSVVPPATVAGIGNPLSLSTGRPGMPLNVCVTPLTTMVEPLPLMGREKVVPS